MTTNKARFLAERVERKYWRGLPFREALADVLKWEANP